MVSAGRAGDVFEPRFTTHGFRYVRIEGHPGPLDRRRRHRCRRPHRPRAPRHVLLQRRADRPAARGGRLELPRQRLRHPHRLPHPRARRLDRRLAALRADRDVPLRRRRLLRQVAARPRGRTVGGRHARQHGADAGRRADRLPGEDERLGRLGRRRRPGAVGALRGVRRRRDARRALADDGGAGSTASSGWPRERPAPRPGRRAAPEPGPARAVPLGHRLPLGRVARARRRARRTSRPSSPPTSPTSRPRSTPGRTRHAAADRARCSARTTRPPATPSSAPASSTPGAPSSSTTTAGSRRTPRPTSCARCASAWCPDELRQRAADDLADLVREADTHLGTGFLATPDLLPVLADHGHLDLAYELLFQDTEPSWLAMIDRGATTVWERWEGIDADGVPARVAQPLLQGRGDLVPAPVRRRPAAPGAHLAPLPRRSPAPAAASPRRPPST